MSDKHRFLTPIRRILFPLPLLLCLALAACALPQDTTEGDAWGSMRLATADQRSDVHRCIAAFAAVDRAVDDAGASDAQAATVAGFPYLRTTRFLAALRQRFQADPPGSNDGAAFRDWVGWLARTDMEGRHYELANLPQPAYHALRDGLGATPERTVQSCATVLQEDDLRRDGFRNALVSTVAVPDDYDDALRVLGLYPLTAMPVLVAFDAWKAQNLASFAEGAVLEMQGETVTYSPHPDSTPLAPDEVAALLRKASDNPFRLPRPTRPDLRRLAISFAPVISVDETGSYDRVGTPTVAATGPPSVDTAHPRLYVQPSWTKFGNAWLLQLSYLAWFPERPPDSALDILAGRLDGLIWRVTLGTDGHPILYDTIHACGCYHLFFPVPPTRLKDRQVDEPAEGTTVPASAPRLAREERIVLHIGSGNHYIRALSTTRAVNRAGPHYALSPMDDLRSLPLPEGGRRSLYGKDGLVAGTARPERFLLWPMGVPSAGAMRQWGHHATAFVGRRHFDDPFLLEKAFTR